MKIILHANTDFKRTKGLMFHDPIDEDECAFFTFAYEGKHYFWNKNVDFPISLIFCNSKFEIVDIKHLDAQQTENVGPKSYEVKYVIEAHKNIPKKLKLKIGDKVTVKENEVTFND